MHAGTCVVDKKYTQAHILLGLLVWNAVGRLEDVSSSQNLLLKVEDHCRSMLISTHWVFPLTPLLPLSSSAANLIDWRCLKRPCSAKERDSRGTHMNEGPLPSSPPLYCAKCSGNYRGALKGVRQVVWKWGEKVAFSCLQYVNKTQFFHPILRNLRPTF